MSELSTIDAVDDLDDLRIALGDDKISLVAYSYGTLVAQLYAECYPFFVRAMVLDGVVDLSEDHAAQIANQTRKFNLAFDRFAAFCAREAACPLVGAPKDALAAYRAILKSAKDGRVLKADGTVVSSADIQAVATAALYWSEGWQELASILSDAGKGKLSPSNSEAVATKVMLRDDVQTSANIITCSDTGPLLIEHPAPYLTGTFSAINDGSEEAESLCRRWPRAGTLKAHLPRRDRRLPQLLFIAQTGDPTTPYGNAVKMSAAFNSPLVTNEGNGHTFVFFRNAACADDVAVSYLREPQKPVADTYCR